MICAILSGVVFIGLMVMMGWYGTSRPKRHGGSSEHGANWISGAGGDTGFSHSPSHYGDSGGHGGGGHF